MGFGKSGTGVIIREDSSVALGTLNAKTGILIGSPTITEDFRVLKSRIAVHIDGLTLGDGPNTLYMVNGELSLAECEEAIELNGPLDRNDRVAQEQAERFVQLVGWFAAGGVNNGVAQILMAAGGSPVVEHKPRWTFSNPEGWDYMIYNESAGNLVTGASAFLKAQHFGVWVQ